MATERPLKRLCTKLISYYYKKMNSKKLSFVIPCFNASKFINQNINRLIKFLKKKNINMKLF